METEQEIIKNFEKEFAERASINKDDPRSKIKASILTHRYGKGTYDMVLIVDWDKLFNENVCPSCEGFVSLKEDTYVCKKCGFEIPVKFFDEAKERHRWEKDFKKRSNSYREKLKKSGLSDEKIGKLYNMALNNVIKRSK